MLTGKKSIFINGRFMTKKMTGVNRFAYEVCLALHKMGVSFTILTPGEPDPCYELKGFNIQKIGWLKSHFWEQISLPLFLAGKNSLLVSFSGLGPVFKKNQICTIHDLSFFEHPEWFSKLYYCYYRLMTPIIVKRVEKILTVSQFSKKEIIRKLNADAHKIHVVYNAITECFRFTHESEYERPEKLKTPYLLTVSSLDPRKNIAFTLRAFQFLGKDIPLYIIGEKNRVFARLGLPDKNPNVHFLGHLSDIQLRDYYANASLFVYPSLYEGFGLPPLEALACGCNNVLVSDIPVFHEIYGNNVFYDKCYSEKKFAIAMESALKMPPSNMDLGALEKKFSWQKTAQRIIDVICLCQ